MSFGSFDSLCAEAGIPVCYLLGQPTTLTSAHNPLILPACTARSIEFGNTIIFEAASDFAHIAALFMTAIMIFHVKSKFTAVGRKEILTFFYLYMVLTALSLVLDAGVLNATNTGPFPWFVAAQNGVISAMCTSLLINGFVGFQLYEDGTRLSIWLLRLTCLGMFVISFAVSLLTFKGWAGLSPTNTTGLFVVVYVVNAVCVAVYVVMQTILVANTLQDRWPLGDLAFGIFFFVVGQILLYVLGHQICEGTSHYLDGLFFATVCNLLGVMMVYKYWDSITKEDLEFSVGAKQGSWDVKDNHFDPNEEFAPIRHSYYDARSGSRSVSRTSAYDSVSMDYRPQSQQQLQYPASGDRLKSHGYATLTEAKQSYGDVRKSVNVHANSLGSYDEHSEREHARHRSSDRAFARARGRSREREVVYDRY